MNPILFYWLLTIAFVLFAAFFPGAAIGAAAGAAYARFWRGVPFYSMTGKPGLFIILAAATGEAIIRALSNFGQLGHLVAFTLYLSLSAAGAFALWRFGLGLLTTPTQCLAPAPAGGTPAPQETAAGRRYPARTPEKRFADLYGYAELKSLLLDHAEKWEGAGENGLLLYGPPGTGKTAFATALAGELGLPIITVSFGDLASKWINQTTEQLMLLFDEALAQSPCVLFVDEIESVLSSRDGGGGYDEYQRMTSAFLSKIEAVRRDGGILYIGATNYPDRLDAAAIRPGRFDWRAEVPLPDYAARRGLMLDIITKRGLLISNELLDRFARRWQGFNVPQLQGAIKSACELSFKDGGQVLRFEHLYRGLRASQGPKVNAPEGARAMSTLTLNPASRSMLAGLIDQLRELESLEAEGGSIVKGVLFYGPPGTGKTTVAKALALEAQWPIVTRMGKDLMDVGAVAKLRNEINSLRPCIMFIDEADDILGHRAYSGVKAATNELLALIDGANSIPDVLWIAATNDPDGMDSAALRGGRFEMKVPFLGLEDDALRHYLLGWLTANPRARPEEPERWIAEIAPLLRGMVPGNLDAVLRAANNRAILENHPGPGVPISLIDEAINQITGERHE